MNRPPLRKFLFSLIMIFVSAIIIELICIVFVYHRYRGNFEKSVGNKLTLASRFLLHQATRDKNVEKELRHLIFSTPAPFRVPDSLHGFKAATGSFEITIQKQIFDSLQKFKYYVTVLPDGSRYVGKPFKETDRDVFVFGDSFVFGEGVNDKQTFTFLLQTKLRETKFHLFANPGHSLSNSYLEFERLMPQIGEEDIVILGHGNYYDQRHVAAPSRIRYYGEPWAIKNNPKDFKHVRALLSGDSLVFDKVPLFCAYAGDYCMQKDPSQSYMDSVTTRLINTIARKSKAKVYLLHFEGHYREQLAKHMDPRVSVIHAAGEDFDYVYQDNVNGFDPHPGPYWHHAMFRKVYDSLYTLGLK